MMGLSNVKISDQGRMKRKDVVLFLQDILQDKLKGRKGVMKDNKISSKPSNISGPGLINKIVFGGMNSGNRVSQNT